MSTIIDIIYNTTHVDFNNLKISVEFRDNTAPLRSSIYSSTLGKCLWLNPNSLDTNSLKCQVSSILTLQKGDVINTEDSSC